jgi:hypothetical protein
MVAPIRSTPNNATRRPGKGTNRPKRLRSNIAIPGALKFAADALNLGHLYRQVICIDDGKL